jgi:Ca-activated chloride channel family protein
VVVKALWCIAALMLCAPTAQAEGGWSSLWRTPDQRGEAELRAGRAAAAAQTYSDPRRKAWAQLKAGDDRAAADSYAGLDAPEAPYNRGNALGRAGALQQALQAYDEALVRNPGDRDAQRNRDLVAKALQPQQRPASQQGRTASNTAGGAGAQPTPQPASGPLGQAPQGSPTPDAAGQQAAPQPQPGQASSPGQAASAGGVGTSAGALGGTDAKDTGANGRVDPNSADSAAQAERDVLGATRSRSGLRTERDTPPPRTEQQLAEDQWLRRLPDDSSGLLRRKFLIQHLTRQGSAP